MDPSEEKKDNYVSPKKKSYLLPAGILLLLIGLIGGIFFFLQSGSNPNLTDQPDPEPSFTPNILSNDTTHPITLPEQKTDRRENDFTTNVLKADTDESPSEITDDLSPVQEDIVALTAPATVSEESQETDTPEVTTACKQSTHNIDNFYSNLDSREYIKARGIPAPSKKYFNTLIQKLLSNPPQVTGETDDLYTILRNTAHFFRISGKDNILLMKGVLNSERDSLEKVLADYYFLLSNQDCSDSPFVSQINRNGLYEYACFFLNTMGGRLYLFRRDSLSRMVVTYYAILLIDQANEQNNNRHGISLKPAVTMLISEMETSGSALQKTNTYLDTLYNLEEKYQ